MKYICVLLSSIVLASCSSLNLDDQNKVEFKTGNGEATFNDLRYDMIRHIATFMEPEDIVNLRYVNCLTLSSLPLKRLVEKTFNIPGLESIADNEPELAGFMRLAHISHDHMLLFKAFLKNVDCEVKPHEVLFSPLILHLFQTLSELGRKEKQECQKYCKRKFKSNVECHMINACLKKRHFDLVLGIVNDNVYLSSEALECAARLGHTDIFKLLLQSGTNIPAKHVGQSLRNAAKNGYSSIVEFIFQCGTYIHSVHVGYALRNAAEKGHISIVKRLLQRRTDIHVSHVKSALRNAAACGNKAIVKLIIHHRKDVPVPANYDSESSSESSESSSASSESSDRDSESSSSSSESSESL